MYVILYCLYISFFVSVHNTYPSKYHAHISVSPSSFPLRTWIPLAILLIPLSTHHFLPSPSSAFPKTPFLSINQTLEFSAIQYQSYGFYMVFVIL